MENQSTIVENLKSENALLLDELATSYKNMEMVLLQSSMEKKIAYKELENKYQLLQHTFAELSKSENLLIHLEKLSSIGQFIAEIIHELNNPLMVISALTELTLLQELPAGLREQLEKISKQVQRMSGYLNRFKAMAYKSEEEFQYFNVNSNLLDFLETIEIVKPKSIKIDKNIATKPMVVKGDPYQISQIYLNLAKNAFDAIEEKGSSLTVTSQEITKKDLIDNDLLGSIYCQNKKTWEKILKNSAIFAHVEFKDDAGGIPPKIVSDIFTPFFTTKTRGKGTGLGLSIATDIVNRHNANLGVRSTLDKGTVFQLFIPLAESGEQPEEKRLFAEAAKT